MVARVIESVDGKTLDTSVDENTDPDDEVYADGSSACKGPENHEVVAHSVGEYVRCLKGVKLHTSGVESFWSMLKRAHKGVYHMVIARHPRRTWAGSPAVPPSGNRTRSSRCNTSWRG